MYGTELPENMFEGQLFFIEDNENTITLPEGGVSGQVLVKQSDTPGDATWSNSMGNLTINGMLHVDEDIGVSGLDVLSSAFFYEDLTCNGPALFTGNLTCENNIVGSKVYGAVWNDYAEYRNQSETIEPGYCVASADNGQVYKTTEKFQSCDGIVSDTFGFAIGETNENKTPIAVAGRVLAYYEGNRNEYHAGDTVCAGPNGKVVKMTREEIREWPDRIIGLVSEIPEYEYWGDSNIPVNNRIWIKIH